MSLTGPYKRFVGVRLYQHVLTAMFLFARVLLRSTPSYQWRGQFLIVKFRWRFVSFTSQFNSYL